MSDNLNELLETKSESNKPKVSETPNLTPESTVTQEKNATQTQPVPPVDDLEITYSPARVTNYKTLKAVGTILKAFAYGFGVGGGIIFIVAALGSMGDFFRWGFAGLGIEVYMSLILGVIGLFTGLSFAFLSESINIFLDIEANSRQAAKTLGRILKAQ